MAAPAESHHELLRPSAAAAAAEEHHDSVNKVLVEICVDSPAGAAAAQRAGADRVELCAAASLGEGGGTPSYGAIVAARQAIQRAAAAGAGKRHPAKLMVLIRPRGGDFCYDDLELQTMLEDVRAAAAAGAAGVACGCLDAGGGVDVPKTRALLEAARSCGLDFTFHRAFDMGAPGAAAAAARLETLIELGVPRVLTSGGAPSAAAGAAALRALVGRAAGRISVMACGKVRANTAAEVVAATGVVEVHAAARGVAESAAAAAARPPPEMTLCGGGAPSDWRWGVTDEAEAAGIVRAVAAAAAAGAAQAQRAGSTERRRAASPAEGDGGGGGGES